MCSPEVIGRVTAAAKPTDTSAGPAPRVERPVEDVRRVCFSTVVDLTHPLPEDFPSANGDRWLEIEPFLTFEADGVNFNRWRLHEHLGTHIDAPIHFSGSGCSAEQIPVASLVVPLTIMTIAERGQDDPDTELLPEDIRNWEAQHGPLPENCCVAVDSGWDRFADGPRYRNADDAGTMHFPGVHVEAARLLLEERAVVGLGVDTLSIDHGPSSEFPTHCCWLPAGRWAIEGLANLATTPPVGATIVVGGPTVVGATGGPSRVFALV